MEYQSAHESRPHRSISNLASSLWQFVVDHLWTIPRNTTSYETLYLDIYWILTRIVKSCSVRISNGSWMNSFIASLRSLCRVQDTQLIHYSNGLLLVFKKFFGEICASGNYSRCKFNKNIKFILIVNSLSLSNSKDLSKKKEKIILLKHLLQSLK